MVISMNTLRRGQVIFVLSDDHDGTNEYLRGNIERGACMDGEDAFSASWCIVGDGSVFEFVSGRVLQDGSGSPFLADIYAPRTPLPDWAKPVVLDAYRMSEGFAPRDRLARSYELPLGGDPLPFSLATVQSI